MNKHVVFLCGLVSMTGCSSMSKIVSKEELLVGKWNSTSTINDVEEVDGEQVSYQMQISCETEYFPTKTFNADCELGLSYVTLPMKMSFDAYMTGTWQVDERYLYTVTEDAKMNLTSVQIEQQIISDSEKIRQFQKEMFGDEKLEDLMPKKETTKYEILSLEQTRLVTQEEWDEQLITVNATRSP